MGVEEVADQLYGLPPEDFTAARTAAARADKPNAKAIGALRRPTVGAWLVNTLVRREPELLDELLALGPALAGAQRAGQGAQLRTLGEQQAGKVVTAAQEALRRARETAAEKLRAALDRLRRS